MPSDPNKAAAFTVTFASEGVDESPDSNPSISRYLATIGRKGGIKGGKARAAALTKSERRAIAKKAAEARWANREG